MAKPPAAPAPSSPGSLKVTERQWQSLTIQPVGVRPFADMATTDGKVAVNDDATTGVFSPYSGRIKRLFARVGDTVSTGAPLFAIEVQEIVQGQSDLATTAAQLKLATATEAPARALRSQGRGLQGLAAKPDGSDQRRGRIPRNARSAAHSGEV